MQQLAHQFLQLLETKLANLPPFHKSMSVHVDIPVTTLFWPSHNIIVDVLYDDEAECCLTSHTKSIVFAFYTDDFNEVAESVAHEVGQCMRSE